MLLLLQKERQKMKSAKVKVVKIANNTWQVGICTLRKLQRHLWRVEAPFCRANVQSRREALLICRQENKKKY